MELMVYYININILNNNKKKKKKPNRNVIALHD